MQNNMDELNLALPYLTTHLPGVGGRLRAEADHFVVEEIALYEACGEGQHLYVNLTKSGLTTREVQLRLERLFGLARGAVGFAGLKDKFARTTQTFSLNVGYQSAAFIDEAVRRIESELPVRVNWAQFHRNKLRPGHLLANRFEITVTDLAVTLDEAVVRSQAIVAEIRRRGLPNFFGVQRFGQKGANAHQGLELLLRRRSIRDRWLRRFLISSYQSHLCNRYLVRRLEIGAFDHLLAGDVAKKVATGGMFDVEEVEREQPRYVAQEINFTAPIYGSRMWQAKAEAGALEQQILASSPVTLMHFEKARIEGSRRVGRLLVPDLAVEASEGKLIARFTLPKGAYATVVMRELMKVDDDHFSIVNEEDENLE
jgi:tRNA pseudouridine13 synthase